MLMLKADAYGHGIQQLVPLIQNEVDAFGVADTDEGISLLQCGAKKPILITGEYDKPDVIVKYGFTPFVFRNKHIEELSRFAYKAGKQIKAHLIVDTGMNRFGTYSIANSKTVAYKALFSKSVKLTGIATHYVSGNIDDIKRQNKIFGAHIKSIENICGRLLRHAASTAAAISTKGIYDMLRVGLGAYGYGKGLNPVMKVNSSIAAIRWLNTGEKAGYNGIYCAPTSTYIAIVKGGYSDGIKRGYIGHRVRIRNSLHKIVAICMDNFIVELSRPCLVGDLVEIVYSDNAIALAEHNNTIVYEILTSFQGRIKRIYNGE